jgi:DNA polymerase-3 subunit chi
MSQVSFYTGVPERLAYVCRLLRKAQQAGASVGVFGASALLDRLDKALWSFEPTEFVPHLRLFPGKALEARLSETPILLAEHSSELPHREVLLNLSLEMPEGFEQFQRVLEVVSLDPEQVEAGRQRFRQYKAMGHEVTHHVVSA